MAFTAGLRESSLGFRIWSLSTFAIVVVLFAGYLCVLGIYRCKLTYRWALVALWLTAANSIFQPIVSIPGSFISW